MNNAYFINGPLHGQFRRVSKCMYYIKAFVPNSRQFYIMPHEMSVSDMLIDTVLYRLTTHPKIKELIYILED
jgi:hypothetical protein